jgi:hypothetical protein
MEDTMVALVRHPEKDSDGNLTPSGLRMAHGFGAGVKDILSLGRNEKLDQIFYSPLARTSQAGMGVMTGMGSEYRYTPFTNPVVKGLGDEQFVKDLLTPQFLHETKAGQPNYRAALAAHSRARVDGWAGLAFAALQEIFSTLEEDADKNGLGIFHDPTIQFAARGLLLDRGISDLNLPEGFISLGPMEGIRFFKSTSGVISFSESKIVLPPLALP